MLNGSRAKLFARTAAPIFSIFVTAEPHYLVTSPSSFVVLTHHSESESQFVEQPLIEGVYVFSRSTLERVPKAKGPVNSSIGQAFAALRLAQRASAAVLAPSELAQAQRSWFETMAVWRERRDENVVASQARETVRLAVVAHRVAEERAIQRAQIATEGLEGGKAAEGRATAGAVFGR
jgi:hypothetical protein